ncbi:MAG TPA: PilZ domain-containing protein [Bdellovibrionota bacterium]|nr:PilZ domain-containing protein [Bdellovibrionota bacterium]
MRRRPLSLTLLSALVAGIAISLPIQIMIRFEIPITEPAAIADKLAPLNWFVMILGAALAGLLYRAAPSARVLAPVFLAILTWNNWLVAHLDPDLDSDLVVIGTVAVYACVAVLLLPPVRKLLMNPTMRWWLTPPRKKLSVHARVAPLENGEAIGALDAFTYDLSEGGVFIKLPDVALAPPIGAVCTVRLDLALDRTVRGVARVVRHAQAQGQYPAGFAVEFEQLPGANLLKLRDVIRELPLG